MASAYYPYILRSRGDRPATVRARDRGPRGIGRDRLGAGWTRRAVGLLGRLEQDLEVVAGEVRERGATADVLVANVADADRWSRPWTNSPRMPAGSTCWWRTRESPGTGPSATCAARGTPVDAGNWPDAEHRPRRAAAHARPRAGHLLVVSSSAGSSRVPVGRGVWSDQVRAARLPRGAAARAVRHRRRSHRGLSGQVATHLHDDDRAAGRMPDWLRTDMAISPERVARGASRRWRRAGPRSTCRARCS